MTSPELRLSPEVANRPDQWQEGDATIKALAYKSKAIECLFHKYDGAKPTKDVSARGETRIREDNTWLVQKIILGKADQWRFAVLPGGRRLIAGVSAGGACFFDRDTFTPITPAPSCKVPCGAYTTVIVDCILGPDGTINVFDVLCSNGNPVCHLSLSERMASLPKGFPQCRYHKMGRAREEAEKLTRESRMRMLLVDSLAHYRPNMRSAMIWRPPREPDVAVLCLRNGQTMAQAAKDECLLRSAGEISPETPHYEHMRCYACKYVSYSATTGGVWKIIEPAKRKEPLFTTAQVDDIVKGTRVSVDDFSMFP